MPNTTNFNWPTPADTDYVTNGALAMRDLGNGIDTSFAELKGGTTGQMLAKASGTDLDFVWTTPNPGDVTAVNVTSPLTGGGTGGDVTVGIQDGTTSQKGAVQLEDSTSSTSTTKAATPNSVKSAYDLAAAALPKLVAFNTQTGTTYTLVAGDATKMVTVSNASAITVTVPPSVFSAGQYVDVTQLGAGQITFAQGAGVTIRSAGATSSAPKIGKQYAAATVLCTASNEFLIIGGIA